ncbi:MAG TPA: hypothetical protein VEU62_08630 [Bryobacterales bacterium]|nr:hypothetical protein [Bryobacterales bacterium]
MARVAGLAKEQVSGEIGRIFERQEQRYGAPLYNHRVLARRPGIFRGFRAMWDGLEEDARLDARLRDLLNVKVASLIGCGL